MKILDSVFLSPFSREDLWTFFTFCFTEEDVENFDVTNLSQDMLRSIEADSFWCMSKLLDGIQVSWFCSCGMPGSRGSWAFAFLIALLYQTALPPCMALPLFGPSISTFLISVTAFKRQWSGVLWSLRKSPYCFVIRAYPYFLLCTQAMWFASTVQGSVRLSPYPAVL